MKEIKGKKGRVFEENERIASSVSTLLDYHLQISVPRTYYSAIVVFKNVCELMERHLFIEIGRVNCFIRCTTFRVHEAE
ncbi:hypothetical protein SDJN03_24174, partial [Cucurbita argyrosperma subsp. sororia]